MSDALITFQENDPIKASETNDNNNFLLNQITQAVQTLEGEMDALESSFANILPIGSIMMWGCSSTIPSGWIAMVGQPITDDAYAALRTALGGRTTLPYTIGKFPEGWADGLNNINVFTEIDQGLPDHNHTYTRYRDINGNYTALGYGGWVFESGIGTSWASASNAIYGRHGDKVQPDAFLVVYIIKYQ